MLSLHAISARQAMLAQPHSNSHRLLRIAWVPRCPGIANRIQRYDALPRRFLDVAGPALTDSLPRLRSVVKIPRENMRSLPRLVGMRVPSKLPRPDGGTGARQGQITAAPEFASIVGRG